MQRGLKAFVLVALPLACAIVITWMLLRRAGVSAEAVAGFGSPRAHAFALTATLSDLLLRGLRTRLLAGVAGHDLSFSQSLMVQLLGEGASAVTPARLGGDPAKLLVMSHNDISIPRGAVVIAGEGLSESIIVTLCALLVIAFMPALRVAGLALLVYPLTILGALAFAVAGAHRMRRALVRWLPISLNAKRRALRAAHAFVRHLRVLTIASRTAVIAIICCTILHVAVRASVLGLLLPEFVDRVKAGALVVWPLALQYGAVAIPLPSGGGGVEAGLAFALRAIVPAMALLPALVWWRFYTFYLGAICGLVALSIYRKRKAA